MRIMRCVSKIKQRSVNKGWLWFLFLYLFFFSYSLVLQYLFLIFITWSFWFYPSGFSFIPLFFDYRFSLQRYKNTIGYCIYIYLILFAVHHFDLEISISNNLININIYLMQKFDSRLEIYRVIFKKYSFNNFSLNSKCYIWNIYKKSIKIKYTRE